MANRNILEHNKSLALPNKNSQVCIEKVNLANHKQIFEKTVRKATSDPEVIRLLLTLYKMKVNRKNIQLYYMHPMDSFLEHISNGTLPELTKYTEVKTKERLTTTLNSEYNG